MHTENTPFDTWLTHNPQGRYIADAQRPFLRAQMRRTTGRVAWASALSLSAGMGLDDCLRLGQSPHADIVSQLPAIPLIDNSIQTLFLPHGLDLCPQPDVLLKECFRVLEAHGRLILTGRNPTSLWRFSRAWQQAHFPAQATSPAHCRHLLTQHGLNPSEGRFMAYAPACLRLQYGQTWRRLEQAGDRWWPHHGALYGLCAIKQLCPLQPIHAEQHAAQGQYQLVFTAASCQQSGK